MDYIPTGGELATKCLEAFGELKAGSERGDVFVEDEPTLRLTSEFIVSAVGLLRKGNGVRESLGTTLPFSALELGLLAVTNLDDHPNIRSAVANRLWDWITFGSLYTNRQAACSAFLRELTPFLDLWDQRKQALDLAAEFASTETADVYTLRRTFSLHDT